MLRSACLMIPLLVSSALGGTFTVDDDGPADFAALDVAIARVSAGDTLLVAPGEYAAFVLDKRLAILGPADGPAPHVSGRSVVAAREGALLAGLSLGSLTLWTVAGEVVVDDCALGGLDVLDGEAALQVVDCQQVLVARSTLTGGQRTDEVLAASQAGLRVIGSRVTAVGCTIEGGAGRDGTFGFIEDGGTAGHGVVVRPDAFVELVDCPSISGGRAGECSGFVCTDGTAGDGVLVASGGVVVVRGTSADTVDAGGCYCTPPFNGQPGHALRAVAGTAVISGASFGTVQPYGVAADGDSTLLEPTTPEPFIALDGGLAAGAPYALRLHGPAGTSAFLALGLDFDLVSLGGYAGPLWLDPAQFALVVAVPLAGQETPVVLASSVPTSPSLVGLPIPMQAAFPGALSALEPGKKLLGNAAAFVVRD